jgi:hypothetical protein
MHTPNKILFHEEQRIRAGFVWIFFVSITALSLGVILFLGAKGNIPKDELFISLGIMLPLYALTTYMMYNGKLVTEVTQKGIYYRWHPIFRRSFFISKESIEQVRERKTPFLHHGFSMLPGFGIIHNVMGRQGLQFRLSNGRQIFIGTQEIFKFKKAVETITTQKIKGNQSER